MSVWQSSFDAEPAERANLSEDAAHKMRIALAFAMFAPFAEYTKNTVLNYSFFGIETVIALVLMFFGIILTATSKFSRYGIALFSVGFGSIVLGVWPAMANHNWLALWCIPLAVVFARWWEEDLYSDYLRVTLAIVMLAAASQKILAGTYFDGSYVAFLSHYGSTTENMFHALCSKETLNNPCFLHKAIGSFIVFWQIAVGILLLIGLRSLIFLAIEIGFLLAAGVFADEMNFQALNIALLCIAFRVGLSYILGAILTFFIVIDLIKIGGIIEAVF